MRDPTMSVLPPPNLIGAPARYDKWRNLQAEAVLAAAESNKRFVIQGAPTGFGKSLVYMAQALLTASRTVILTSTKALQGQLLEDFRESGLIEIKGLNAYECIEGRPTGKFGDVRREGHRADRGLPMMCDEGPCQAGAWCQKRDSGCLYYDAYRAATNSMSKLVVTNYAYWMSIHKFGEGMGHVDLLILDEAHNAIDELGNFIGTELRSTEAEALLPGATILSAKAEQADWVNWAIKWNWEAGLALERIKASIREAERGGSKTARLNHGDLRRARDLKRLQHKLATISGMAGEWVIDRAEDNYGHPMVKFDPVWPGEYAEKNLFLGVPKVVMVSATVRPKTAEMLGVSYADMDFKEYPSSFNKAHRPIIYHPSGPMNARSEVNSIGPVTMAADNIIGRRLDRKALIQTVSYKRARQVYMGSRYKHLMLMHDNTNTKEVIAQFKASRQPVILVSPVLDTGYDFPYEQAEYQILIKVPFPVTVDKVVKARVERDPDYKDYVTMITLVQQAGRIVRADDDTGETFILDSDFGWWYFGSRDKVGKGYKLSPKWFTEAVRTEQVLGMPLPKIRRVA